MDKQERFLTHKRVVSDSDFYYHNLNDIRFQIKKSTCWCKIDHIVHMWKLSASKIFSVSGFVQHVKEKDTKRVSGSNYITFEIKVK